MDPITDMLNRIKNAQAVGHTTVDIPFSEMKWTLAGILEREKFIAGVEKQGRRTRKNITIVLSYKDKTPAIHGMRKISKPGQRIYASWHEIPSSRFGGGVVIVSTSKGLMTGKEARKNKLGGEVLCEVW